MNQKSGKTTYRFTISDTAIILALKMRNDIIGTKQDKKIINELLKEYTHHEHGDEKQ